MRVYTKLTAVIADDAGLARRYFSTDKDIEENDDTSILGAGSPGGITVPNTASAPNGVVINLQTLVNAKHLILLVDGSVLVYLNNSSYGLKVSSSGADKTFVWGKLLLTGTDVTAITIKSTSASASAKCLIGYAG